jgi:spore germination protein KC
MNQYKKIFSVILMLLLALPMNGCWNRRELNTLGIIGMVGVDADPIGVKSTFEIIEPEKSNKASGDNPKVPVKYVQATGRTVIETFRGAPLRFDRKLFVSHAKTFLFSEELARNGLAKNLDMILRDHEMRLSMHLAIVKDSPASDVMGITSGINTIPSNYIDDLFKQYKVHSTSVDSKILDFLKAYEGKGINPVITVLKKVKKTKIGQEKEEYELSPEGAAVFSKDRLVGFLDGPETRGYNWIIGNVVSGIVTFPTPNSNGDTSVEVIKSQSKNEVELTDNGMKLKVKITMTGMLDEQTANWETTDQEAVMEMLEQANSETIKQEVEHTLRKLQTEYKSDIFGFGQLMHRQYPEEWKTMQDHWDEWFSQASIEVEVKVNITKTGKSSYPVKE